jgi:hypothetical protein
LEFGAQRDASTDTTAVQLRCSLGVLIGENWTSLSVKAGRQRFSATAPGSPVRSKIAARSAAVQVRIETLTFVMALLPVHGVEQRLDDASLQKPGGCVGARRFIIYGR